MPVGGTVPGRIGVPETGAPGAPGVPGIPGPGGGTDKGWIRMFISNKLKHRRSATYKVLGESAGHSHSQGADQGNQKHYEVLYDSLAHYGPATHLTSSCTLSAYIAVPKRLGT